MNDAATWLYHPESDCVFLGERSDLEADGNLVELTAEESAALLRKLGDRKMGKLLEALEAGHAVFANMSENRVHMEQKLQECLDLIVFFEHHPRVHVDALMIATALIQKLAAPTPSKIPEQKAKIDDTPKLPFTELVLPLQPFPTQTSESNPAPISAQTQAVSTRTVSPVSPPLTSVPPPPPPPAVQQAVQQAATPTVQSEAMKEPAAPTPAVTNLSVFKFVESDELWGCDRCGAPNCAFGLSLMNIAQRGDSIFIPYKCLKCNADGNALLSDADVAGLAARLPQGSFAVNSAPVADAPPKKGRKKAAENAAPPAAPAPEVAPAAPAANFSEPKESTAEVKASVAALFNQAPEVNLAAAEKVVREQVQQWPLETLIKEWEGFTGKTYQPGVTVPATMADAVIKKLAGLPT